MPVQKTGAENPSNANIVTPWLREAVRTAGRDHPEDGPEHDCEHLRAENQEQGGGETLEEELRHRAVEEERVAEIEPRELGHVGEELLVEGAIQAVVAADLGHDLRVGAAHVARDGVRHVARRDVDQGEVEDEDGDQQGEPVAPAPDEEHDDAHAACSGIARSAASGSAPEHLARPPHAAAGGPCRNRITRV